MEILMKTYDSHSKNLRYLLRYEDLLKNPLPELKKIYNFLDITVDEDTLKQLVNKFDFKNIPANEKGKDEFRRFASPGKYRKFLQWLS